MRTKLTTTIGLLLAALTLAACGGDDNGGGGGSGDSGGDLPANTKTDFVAGCTATGVSEAGCECMYEELTGTQGIDTEEELIQLQEDIQEASQQPDPAAAMPQEFRDAAEACKDQLQQQ
jgi:hypothetical protein